MHAGHWIGSDCHMIEFLEDRVRKTGPVSTIAMEFAKTCRAAALGRKTRQFYVPRILHFDREAGVLEFERLHGWRRLGDLALESHPCLEDMLKRTGQALAVIHSGLWLEEDKRIAFPAEWMAYKVDCAFLHGDYGPINIGLDLPTGRLVILDWSPTPYLQSIATFGPRYFDLAWFVVSLHFTMATVVRRQWPARLVCDTFLKAYLSARCEILDRRLFSDFLAHAWRLLRSGMASRLSRRRWHKKPQGLVRELLSWARFRMYRPGKDVAPSEAHA